ncbi:MAG: GNAT family N-acetyltransferase [Stappiaceae bacterium]
MSDDNWQTILPFELANLSNRPSSETIVDGDWIVRLTKGHPSRRLNSLTILSPTDHKNFRTRLGTVFDSFVRNDRPLCVRWTPLMPIVVDAHLSILDWSREAETVVMAAHLEDLRASRSKETSSFSGNITACSLEEWIAIYCDLGGITADAAEQLLINFEKSSAELCCLVAKSKSGVPLSVVMAAIEGDLVGFFEVFTAPHARRQGCASELIAEALRTGSDRGAKTTWLQVMSSSRQALRLYEKIGYDAVYSYHYRKPPN